MLVISEPQRAPKTPLIARFAAVRYELPELEEGSDLSIYASGKGIFGSDPTTYSATTSTGKDRDTDDKGQD